MFALKCTTGSEVFDNMRLGLCNLSPWLSPQSQRVKTGSRETKTRCFAQQTDFEVGLQAFRSAIAPNLGTLLTLHTCTC